MILLSVINNENFQRLSYSDIDTIADKIEFNRPKISIVSSNELFEFLQNNKNIEGFVTENKYGHLIKVKTDDYLSKHRDLSAINSLGRASERSFQTVLKAYADNTLDDIIAYLSMKKDNAGLNFALAIQKEITNLFKCQEKIMKEFQKWNKRDWFNRKDMSKFELNLWRPINLENEVELRGIVTYLTDKYKNNTH